MRNLASTFAAFGLLLTTGCPGTALDEATPDGGSVDQPDAPATPDPVVKLSGKTMDYFTPTQAMDNVAITSDGLAPAVNVTSAVGGAYELADLPTGSTFYVSAVRTLYRPTRSAPIVIAGESVVQDIYLMTLADVARQYATTNNPLAPGKAFFAAELQRANGNPMIDIPLADITLVDGLGAPVPGVKGPYVFGSLGDIDPELTTTAAFGGKARIAFLDVPPGTYSLKVSYTDGGGGIKTHTTSAMFVENGATIALSKPAGGMGGGGGGGGMTSPAQILTPKFGVDIYPLLQRASAGGLGCGNCHTATGAAAVLPFDGGAQITLDLMKARVGVLDLVAPANSLFLTKPLYEPAPVNHPNATFLDINDEYYKLFLRWITQGALL
ncbi:MAG: carboxypeptidase-like regulatory domain-containing protein [Kofleriaceae bacterium]|nr:carboxypeptidase-like regulatory domain-containing protein [Kofleriaceae bacterium]